MASFPLSVDDFLLDTAKRNFYYGQYPFKITLNEHYLHYLRSIKDTVSFDRYWEWRQSRSFLNHSASTRNRLHEIFVFLSKYIDREKFKLVFSYNTVSIFIEDRESAEELRSAIDCSTINLNVKFWRVEQVADWKKDNVYLKNPKYAYRAYFNIVYLSSPKEISSFKKYLERNNIHYCPSLLRCLRHKFSSFYLTTKMFIDLDDTAHLTYLMLSYGDCIRKVCPIVQG